MRNLNLALALVLTACGGGADCESLMVALNEVADSTYNDDPNVKNRNETRHDSLAYLAIQACTGETCESLVAKADSAYAAWVRADNEVEEVLEAIRHAIQRDVYGPAFDRLTVRRDEAFAKRSAADSVADALAWDAEMCTNWTTR